MKYSLYSTIQAYYKSKNESGILLSLDENNDVFVEFNEMGWQCIDKNWDAFNNYCPPKLQDICIIGYDYQSRRYTGSFKCGEGDNPFSELFRMPAHSVFHAQKKRMQKTHMEDCCLLLPNGSFGNLAPTADANEVFSSNSIDVIIYTLWIRKTKAILQVEPFPSPSRPLFRPAFQLKSQKDFLHVLEYSNTRLEHDAIISAVIEKIEPCGVFLSFDDKIIYTNALNISWDSSFDIKYLTLKKKTNVRIMGFDYINGIYYGSIRHADPVNPYILIANCDPNSIFQAKILRKLADDKFEVVLRNNAYATLTCQNDVKVNDIIDVAVQHLSVEADYNNLSVGLVENMLHILPNTSEYVSLD